MTRADEIGGVAPTFASLRMWDEAIFKYREIVICVRGRDATAELQAEHDPPLVYVVSIRRYP